MEEPRLHPDKMAALVRRYTAMFDTPEKRAAHKPRDRVRLALRSLNDDLRNGTAPVGTPAMERNTMEKWKSVVAEAEGSCEPSFTLDEAILVGAVFDAFSRTWDRLNPPRDTTKATWRFPERAHFPNFNATFRAISASLGIPIDPDDFPIPVGARCIDSTHRYLRTLFAECTEVRLVYDPVVLAGEPQRKKAKVNHGRQGGGSGGCGTGGGGGGGGGAIEWYEVCIAEDASPDRGPAAVGGRAGCVVPVSSAAIVSPC